MDKFGKRVLLIIEEILNWVTNLLAFLMPLVMIICEICGVPEKTLLKIKEIEYMLFNAYGTRDCLDTEDDKTEK